MLHFHTAADLDAAALSAVLRRIRSRVPRLGIRRGALTPEVAADLARSGHGGGWVQEVRDRLPAPSSARFPLRAVQVEATLGRTPVTTAGEAS